MSTNLKRTCFEGRLLFEYAASSLALSCTLSNYLQTLRMIYMGKSSAFTGHQSAPKPSQAEMHGMREVFPEAVSYAAVQVSPQRLKRSDVISQGASQAYYGLCSLDGWDTEDRFFKLDVFFNKCVQLFTEDPDDPWVIDTLQFLTK